MNMAAKYYTLICLLLFTAVSCEQDFLHVHIGMKNNDLHLTDSLSDALRVFEGYRFGKNERGIYYSLQVQDSVGSFPVRKSVILNNVNGKIFGITLKYYFPIPTNSLPGIVNAMDKYEIEGFLELYERKGSELTMFSDRQCQSEGYRKEIVIDTSRQDEITVDYSINVFP